jgi:hypoxanthine phosphoribosyltransferase
MKKLVTAHGLSFEPLIGSQEIAARVEALGQEIREVYENKYPLFLCVLNGAFVFAADLLRACEIACEVSFVRLASYDGMASSGHLKKLEPASVALAVLLVKPDAVEFPIQIDYRGFEIANKFVVGYGLDYDGQCRNLKEIYQLYTHE